MPRQTQLKKRLRVVAGILQDARGRILITERVDDGPFHGLWEFPGGKISPGETPQAALARELREEIGVEPSLSRHFMSLEHDYPDRHVAIDFYLVSEWRFEPAGLEGQGLRWVTKNELDGEALLPADKPVVVALKSQQILS